jgi:hypothetical protein
VIKIVKIVKEEGKCVKNPKDNTAICWLKMYDDKNNLVTFAEGKVAPTSSGRVSLYEISWMGNPENADTIKQKLSEIVRRDLGVEEVVIKEKGEVETE